MEFKVNDYKWKIELSEKDNVLMNADGSIIFGLTMFENQTIYIRKSLTERMTHSTVLHELTHCYLFSHGINNGNYTYDEEQVCNFVGAYGKEINDIAERFMKMVRIEDA